MDGKGTIHYLGGYERNVGNGAETAETVTKYYRALGRMIAFRRNGSLYWVGTDHLGGTLRVANSSFSPIAQMRYMPYGASRDNTDDTITDYLFTSQQLDASIGLYWYGSRAYDPELGRFLCADTIVPSAGNPQSLNRYAYTYNNPLRYTDPTGHISFDGMGIVVYDHPDYLSEADRGALYEHNVAASAAGAATEYVHESGGGAEDGDDPWEDRGVVDLERYGVNPSYLSDAARGALYDHNMTFSNGALAGTADPGVGHALSSSMQAKEAKLGSALAALKNSGPAGISIYQDFVGSGGKVRFGGMEPIIRNGSNSIGWNGRIYLAPSLMNEPDEILASFIAHEAYHARQSVFRYPFTRREEVAAFAQEARAWEELQVTYKPNATGNPDTKKMLDEILAASKVPAGGQGGLAAFVVKQDIYNPDKSRIYRD